MNLYDIQLTTELEGVIILQVSASSQAEAEMTAISVIESGQAGTEGTIVVDSLYRKNKRSCLLFLT